MWQLTTTSRLAAFLRSAANAHVIEIIVAIGSAGAAGLAAGEGIPVSATSQSEHDGFAMTPAKGTVTRRIATIYLSCGRRPGQPACDYRPVLGLRSHVHPRAGRRGARGQRLCRLRPATKAILFMVGGGIALTAHGTKAATRVAINASPHGPARRPLWLVAQKNRPTGSRAFSDGTSH